jgi:hydrogenase-4 component B
MFDLTNAGASYLWLTAGIALLVIGAALAPLLRNNKNRVLTALASQGIGSALVLVAVIPVLLGGGEIRGALEWAYPIGSITIQIGALSAFFLAWSLPMTFLGSVYAVGYLAHWFGTERNVGVHFSLLNMVAVSFVVIYSVENAMLYLLGWEIAALAAWLLVIWEHGEQRIRFAGFNYLVSTHVGLIFLVAAFMLLFAVTQSLDFTAFGSVLRAPGPLRDAVFVLLCLSFALKSAFFPFHSWLPRAHAAAPAHVSALMSGVIHKAGLFGLLKFTLLLGRPETWMGVALLAFGGLSAVMGVLNTTSQRDIKRLLGYSSTENVGIAMMGIGVGYLGLASDSPMLVVLGFSAAVLHILNHALFKCLLFYGAGSVYKATHTVELELLGGLAKKMPITASFFLIGSLAIAGVPLLNGFVSEFMLYSALFSPDAATRRLPLILAAASLAFVGGVSALSMTRCFGVAFLGAPRNLHHAPKGEAPWTMHVAMFVHAIGIACIGLVPSLGFALVERVIVDYAGKSALDGVRPQIYARLDALAPFTIGLALSIGLLALVRKWRSKAFSHHVTWGCGYTAPTARMQYTAASFASPFLAFVAPLLPHARTEHPPEGVFPEKSSVATHYFDAAERRIFKLIRDGEAFVERMLQRLPEKSTSSFGLGLLVLVVSVTWIVKEGAR